MLRSDVLNFFFFKRYRRFLVQSLALFIAAMWASFVHAQPQLQLYKVFCDSLSFSKISADNGGVWAISGDSNTVYHFDYANSIKAYPQFRVAPGIKFTSILACDSNRVLVGTDGDYLIEWDNDTLYWKNDTIQSGLKGSHINSIKLLNSKFWIGTDRGIYLSDSVSDYNKLTFHLYTHEAWMKMANDFNMAGYIENAGAGDFTLYYYITFWNPFYMSVHLNQSDNINSFILYNDWSTCAFLGTDNGLRLAGSYQNSNITYIQGPIYNLTGYSQNLYCFVAADSGLYRVQAIDVPEIIPIIKGLRVMDVQFSNWRILWAATGKGLYMFRNTVVNPSLETKGIVNVCLPFSLSNAVVYSLPEDSISWYRNDTLISGLSSTNISITEPGNYYAIIKNKYFGFTDTTLSANYDAKFESYSYEEPYQAYVQLCNGNALSINIYSIDPFQWVKDSIPIGIPNMNNLYVRSPGTYSALLTNCNNYTYYSPPIHVDSVAPYGEFNFPLNQTICGGDTLSLILRTNANRIQADDNTFLVDSVFKLCNRSSVTFSFLYDGGIGCDFNKSYTAKIQPLPFTIITGEGNTLTAGSQVRDYLGNVALSYDLTSRQWYLNDQPLDGAVDSVIQAMVPGNYKVRITDANGCSNVSSDYMVYTAGTGIEQAGILKAYPNPSRGAFTISGIPSTGAKKIEILNSIGQKVMFTADISGSEIPVRLLDCESGIYQVRIHVGSSIFSLRVMLLKNQ